MKKIRPKSDRSDVVRIGEKLINKERLFTLVGEILSRRSKGATQAEVASILGVERSFVSHLEGLAQIRRGKRMALVGFPVSNKEELAKIAKESGFDVVLLLSQDERNIYVDRQPGAQFFNEMLDQLVSLKECDLVVVLASEKRIATMERLLDREVFGIPIGASPIKNDVSIDPAEISRVLKELAENGGGLERGRKRQFRIFKKRSYRPA